MGREEQTHRSAIDVMHGHFSCRRFSPEPVNDDLLETLIEAGTRASTSSNMQAYTVISITDPSLKLHMAKLCADQRQIHESAAFLAFCADLYRLKLCAEMHGVDDFDLGLTEALVMSVVDTALVMENVAVAAESVGLGVCMIGALRNEPFEVREALFLPKYVFPVAGMCIGWPAKQHEPKPRLPLDAVWHRDRYRSDQELHALIEAYDGILAAFYESLGVRSEDPRWSSIMAQRLAIFRKRMDVGRLLREQGFDTQAE
jgi:nitroreductase